jgi:hypothetical protein
MYFFQFISSPAWKNQLEREIHFKKSLSTDSSASFLVDRFLRAIPNRQNHPAQSTVKPARAHFPLHHHCQVGPAR